MRRVEAVIQSPVVNTVAGAMEIQKVFEWREWVSQTSNPVAFAPHLRKDPLPGVPVRPVLFQFAIGDQIAPNPTNAAILRAGHLADRATIYRNDLAFAENSAVPKNPHEFLLRIDSPIPLVRLVRRCGGKNLRDCRNRCLMTFTEAIRKYETWLAGVVPASLDPSELEYKHQLLADPSNPFPFFRGTYYR